MKEVAPSEIQIKRQRASTASRRVYSRRRQTIIAAAAEVFHSKGLANTTLVDISDKLDVDRASLYYYFKDKHELFRAVILDSIGALIDEVEAIGEKPAPSRSKLVEIYASVIRAFAEHYPTLHLYLQEDMEKINASEGWADPEGLKLADLADTYMVVTEKLIREGISSGEFRAVGDPRVIALLIQGSINWMHRWYDPLSGPPAEEIARTMIEVAFDGLMPR